ncbi:MAG: hypothetical protein WC812_02845 [Candidatus Pacearchaeota archaeon]|jgi:hypothetical protein
MEYKPQEEPIDSLPSKYIRESFIPKTIYFDFKKKGLSETFSFDSPICLQESIMFDVTNNLGYTKIKKSGRPITTIDGLQKHLEKMNKKVFENIDGLKRQKEYLLLDSLNEAYKGLVEVMKHLEKQNRHFDRLINEIEIHSQGTPKKEQKSLVNRIIDWLIE